MKQPTPQFEEETLQIQGHRPGELLVERTYKRDLGSGTEGKHVREWLPLDVLTEALGTLPVRGVIHTTELSAEARELIEHEAERLTFEVDR